MNVDLVLTQMLNGLVLGMTLVLIAIGLALIFGLMNILNFAHGAFLLLGTYVAWTVMSVTGNFVLGLILAPLVVAAIGLLVERFALRRIYGENHLLQLVLTYGFAELFIGAVELIWGKQPKQFPVPSWGAGSIDFGVFQYPVYQIVTILLAAAAVVGLFAFLERTDYGLIIRASLEDREIVSALGIDISKAYLLVFGVGCGLAGLAGALLGPIRGAYPGLGMEIIILAFVVVVIGGMGSLVGSVLSGLIIGQIISLSSLVYPAGSNIAVFLFMVLVLLVRPDGLFGISGVGD